MVVKSVLPVSSGMWSRCQRLAALVLASGALTGCASYFGAQVTSFHQPGLSAPPGGQGLSFQIRPSAAQADSLAFQAYAAQVRQQLLAHGMQEHVAGRHDVDVTIDYSVDGGQPVSYRQPEYAYVYQGSQLVRRDRVLPDGQLVSYWEHRPVYGYDLVGYSTYQRVFYRHELKLRLTRTQARPGQLARLYEGTASTESQDSALNNVVPLLIRALFQDFPGPNGVSRRVEVQTDPGWFGERQAGQQRAAVQTEPADAGKGAARQPKAAAQQHGRGPSADGARQERAARTTDTVQQRDAVQLKEGVRP